MVILNLNIGRRRAPIGISRFMTRFSVFVPLAPLGNDAAYEYPGSKAA